jgi:hypothetical protein
MYAGERVCSGGIAEAACEDRDGRLGSRSVKIVRAHAGARHWQAPQLAHRQMSSYPSAASDFHAISVGDVRHAMSPVPIHLGTPNGRSRGGMFSRSAFLKVLPVYGVPQKRRTPRHSRD